MRHVLPNFLAAGFLLLLSFDLKAQQPASKISVSDVHKNGVFLPNEEVYDSKVSAKTAVLTNCTDKINYVGNVTQYYVNMGGPSSTAITGLYQTFEDYEGKVVGVEFDASKSPTISGNPVVYVRIYGLNVSPMTNIPLSPLLPVTITNTTVTSYSVMFATPITISNNNGFAVGITNAGNASGARIQLGPLLPNNFYNYSFVTDFSGGSYPYNMSNYFSTNGAVDVLIRPIVTTTVNPTWTAVKTSSGCALPVVYDFNNTTPYPSAYVNNTMICPGGLIDEIDLGDGSIPMPFYSTSHSYTSLGNYIASFKETYVGWNANCIGTISSNIQVDNPIPSFGYSKDGLSVTFTNTSVGLNNFIWNFGDLTTSSIANPTHQFNSPGTYVVELEGTAPCGTVRYSISITVSAVVGIEENKLLSEAISIYPNPAQNYLVIGSENNLKLISQIDIYNSCGALVKSVQKTKQFEDKLKFEISDLQSGVYFIRLNSEKGVAVKSFIKD